MARLSKSKRDALKADGKWNFSKQAYIQGLTGAEIFAQAAAAANPTPIPFAHVRLDTAVVEVTPVPSTVSGCFDDVLSIADGISFAQKVYPGAEASECFANMQSAFLVDVAARIMQTHGVEVVGSHQLPEVGLPDFLFELLKPIGACYGNDYSIECSDVPSIVKSLLWASTFDYDMVASSLAIQRSWLPTVTTGGHTDHLLSVRFAELFKSLNIDIGIEDLRGCFFSGVIPAKVSRVLGLSSWAYKKAFTELFKSFKDAPGFYKNVTTTGALELLQSVGFSWSSPSPLHLCLNKHMQDLIFMVEKKWSGFIPKGHIPMFYPSDLKGSHPHGSVSQALREYGVESGKMVGPDIEGLTVDEIVGHGVYSIRMFSSGKGYAVYQLPFPLGEFDLSSVEFKEEGDGDSSDFSEPVDLAMCD